MTPDDEVDLVISAWSEHLPDVDLTPLDVMSRLRRVSHGLQGLRRAAFLRAGLTIWEFDVLSALRRAEAPGELTASQLTHATMIGTPAMSNRIKNLTASGLVERRYDRRDQRVTLISLTPEGIERVDRAMRELVEAERRELDALDPADQQRLVRILRQLGTRLHG
jgi:DNA-binding MarR family transcriptional regulator